MSFFFKVSIPSQTLNSPTWLGLVPFFSCRSMWIFMWKIGRLPVQTTDPASSRRDPYKMTPMFRAYWAATGETYRGAKVFYLKMMDPPDMIQTFHIKTIAKVH